MLEYVILFVGWAAFYALHSLLAHQLTKNYFMKLTGSYFKFYRLVFNVISVAYFLLLLLFQFSLPVENFISNIFWLRVLGGIIFIMGATVLLTAFSNFNKAEFIGIEQLTVNNSDNKDIIVQHQLVKTGMYGYVRHPLYFGVIIMLIGALMYFPNYSTLIFVITTFIYLPIGVSLEENKLVDEFGEQYLQYRKEVKMLVPFVF
jgi:protein-S-isoprenylcysteine O-methyltransferase Ste14